MALMGAMILAPTAPAAPSNDSLAVGAVRFYRAEMDGQTRVRAFVQVPYSILVPGGSGDASQFSYQVSVTIADSSGTAQYQDTWSRHAPGSLRGSGGYLLEMLEFLIPAGTFDLTVSVRDSVTDRVFTAAAGLQGYGDSPVVSDLLLAPEMRPATAADSLPAPGMMRIGNIVVTATAEVVLTPLRATIHYLFEAYSDQDTTGQMRLAVVDGNQRVLIQTPPAGFAVPAGGGVMKGELDLTGLPEGTYSLRLTASVAGESVQRTAAFRMAGMVETLARDSVRRMRARITDEGYFAAMNEAQLDSAKAPLIYVARNEDNLRLYDDLSVQAKRAYLTRFWKERDPSPGSPRNEAREEFYGAVNYANQAFGESDRGLPGWQSDRGRVFAKYGRPNDIWDRPDRANGAPPYQVWQYFSGKYRYFIFADLTGFGAYALLHTNDINENGRADWREMLTVDAVLDVQDYLGISFINSSGEF